MRRRTLFWQVFPAYVALTVVLVLLIMLEGQSRFQDFFLDQTSTDLAASAAMFAEAANGPLEGGRYAEVDVLAKRLGKASGMRITVVLPNGKVVAESAEDPALLDSHRTRQEIAAALDTKTMAYDVRFSHTLQQSLLYVAVPLLRDGRPWAVVRLSAPAVAIDEASRAFERRIVYGALGAVALVIAAGWVVARRMSRPLEVLTRGAEHFGRGELGHRLPSYGSRETVALAETLNRMAADLSAQLHAAAIQQSQQEAVLQSMEEAVLTIDNQGTILNLNRAAGEMFQLDPRTAPGRPIHEVLRKADVLKFTDEALSSPLPLQKEIVIYDKQRRSLVAYGNALRDGVGRRIGVLAVFREMK
jgi:two-component system, OmpR family, phosphate regulon sensor histidine kinase PhoR